LLATTPPVLLAHFLPFFLVSFFCIAFYSKMTDVAENQQQPADGAVGKQLAFDPNVKHPLYRGWTLWFDSQLTSGKRPGGNDWGANIKEVYSFHSVEDFWRLYNNITLPSQLQIGCSYNLFKEGIEPKWEDPSNAKGGKWTLIIQKTKGLLDKLWLWLILGCIGEMLEGMEDVCGIVVNVRKGQDKLCIWTKDAENQDAVVKMGLSIKKALELPDQFPVGYQGHFQKNSRLNKYEV
jgi:translation initiation factor 4E